MVLQLQRLVGMSLALSLWSLPAAAVQIEEMLVSGKNDERDPTLISADAEALLGTAGAVGGDHAAQR